MTLEGFAVIFAYACRRRNVALVRNELSDVADPALYWLPYALAGWLPKKSSSITPVNLIPETSGGVILKPIRVLRSVACRRPCQAPYIGFISGLVPVGL